MNFATTPRRFRTRAWIDNGGFKEMRCIALEPCTAPYDRPGDEALPPGDEIRFSLALSVE